MERGLLSQIGGSTSKVMQAETNLLELSAMACGAVPLYDFTLIDQVDSAIGGHLSVENVSSSAFSATGYEAAAATAAEVREIEFTSHWNNDSATLCGRGATFDELSLNSLLGDLFESSSVMGPCTTQARSFISTGESSSRHDSGLSSISGCDMWLLQPVTSTQLPSAYQTVMPITTECCEDAPVAQFSCEAGSPAASHSVVTLTDEEEDILADLNQLMTGAQAGSEANLEDEATSEASHWLSRSDDTSSVGATEFSRVAVPLVSTRAVNASANAQTPATGRRRGRKRCVSPSTRRERKRQQNREAAQRYRNRKNGEVGTLEEQVESMEERNRELRDELQRATTERSILLRFADRFDLRSLLREQMLASKNTARSSSASLKLDASLASLEKMAKHDATPQTAQSRSSSTRIVTIVHPASKSTAAAVQDAGRKRRELCVNQMPSKVARQ